MKKTFVLSLLVVFAVTSLVAVADAKRVTRQSVQFESSPRPDAPLPPDLVGQLGGLRSAAAADTFVLLDEDFDQDNGLIPAGWTTADITDQLDAYFHVADSELNGGTFGNLIPLGGSQSMWCGVSPTTAVPYCGYSSLPGYGNGWDQFLNSSFLDGDSVSV
ncbi:MAG: hypothetical protein R3284_13040, partial [Rubricoccaceae bacterium]|nr:hypothetical protein [Rubricoccaceae bacterium]